jgi:hypothetical protein
MPAHFCKSLMLSVMHVWPVFAAAGCNWPNYVDPHPFSSNNDYIQCAQATAMI